MKSAFNPGDPGNTMVVLLEKPNVLSAVKSTDVATIKSFITKLQAEATAASTTNITVPPKITTRVEG